MEGSGNYLLSGLGVLVVVVAYLIEGRRWARISTLVLAGVAVFASWVLAVAEVIGWSAAFMNLAGSMALVVLLTGRSHWKRTERALLLFFVVWMLSDVLLAVLPD